MLLAQPAVLDIAMAPVRFSEDQQQQQQQQQQPIVKPEDKVDNVVKEKRTLKKSARAVMLKARTVKTIKKMNSEDSEGEEQGEENPDGALLSRKVDTLDTGRQDPDHTWPGKDYVNWIVRDLAR